MKKRENGNEMSGVSSSLIHAENWMWRDGGKGREEGGGEGDSFVMHEGRNGKPSHC